MKAHTAEHLVERAMRISDDLNEMVRDIEANEPDDESARLRHAIGRVMWAVYYEILRPTFEEHPSVEPQAGTTASPATKMGPAPREPRTADRPARSRSRRPPAARTRS